ncbi:MAG: 3-phosphoshikimate 1-carboxyvinyltransferase [Rectinema sp.]
METRTVHPAVVRGSIRAPASKSAMQRAIACAMLGRGTSLIKGSPVCADARAALRIAQRLGAEVREFGDSIEIDGSPLFGKERIGRAEGRRTAEGPLEISCGESGLCIRMFSPIVALLDDTVRLVGEGSLLHRPMHMVETSLGLFGVPCISNKGKPPLTIKGPLGPRQTTVDAQGSSQLITGLLIALPLLAGDSEVKIENLVSAGYLDLTREMCAQFGVHVEKNNSGATFFIKGGQSYRASEVNIEGDWSGGAFLAVAAAIAGETEGVCIQGLSPDSRQPDRAIVEALAAAGARIRYEGSNLIVQPGRLLPFRFDANNCPDIFPPLVALASSIRGISRIRGVHRLSSKESDRASALQTMFSTLGAEIKVEGDEMLVKGGVLHGGIVSSWGDHRIAMATAVAALAAEHEVSIEGAECVSKSWPGFFEDLASICRPGEGPQRFQEKSR